jgi:hypothetical protein
MSCGEKHNGAGDGENWAITRISDAEDAAASHLMDMSNRAQVMTEWWLELNTTRWLRDQPMNVSAMDLVEARYHVANAEVFDVAMENIQRAAAELDRADSYLSEAQTQVDDRIRPAIATIRAELMGLRSDGGTKTWEIEERLEAIKLKLDRLIARRDN